MEKLKKGLAPGDLFEDGGRVYEVKAVREDGTYLSAARNDLPEESGNPGRRHTSRGGGGKTIGSAPHP